MSLKILTRVVTPFSQNCRVLVDSKRGVGALLDPGGDIDLVLAIIEDERVKVEQVLLTHSHIDHVGGVVELLSEFALRGWSRPTIVGHQAESEFRKRVEEQALYFGLSSAEFRNCPEPDIYIAGGEVLNVGEYELEVRFVPGHSPGHVVFVTNEIGCDLDGQKVNGRVVFAGDTLFAGSIGRTDLPGGDPQLLLTRIESELMSLNDEAIVLPGHGPATTIGKERRSNPFLIN